MASRLAFVAPDRFTTWLRLNNKSPARPNLYDLRPGQAQVIKRHAASVRLPPDGIYIYVHFLRVILLLVCFRGKLDENAGGKQEESKIEMGIDYANSKKLPPH